MCQKASGILELSIGSQYLEPGIAAPYRTEEQLYVATIAFWMATLNQNTKVTLNVKSVFDQLKNLIL